MRGVSAIVELLLITLLLISLVSLLWLFTSGTINVITKSGTNQTQRTQEIFSTCMIMDSISGNTVYLKNCGYGVITNDSLGVYLDDTPLTYTMTPQKIDKGGVGTITTNLFGISIGIHNLRITNPNTQTVQQVEASLPDSCFLALDFDEGSGTTVHDSLGNGNYGTLLNGPAWVDGKFGKALSFDGTDDYVLFPYSNNLNFTSFNQLTVETLVNFRTVNAPYNYQTLMQKDWNIFRFMLDNGGHFVFSLTNIFGSQAWLSDNTNLYPNRWYHVVGVFNSTHLKIYINGSETSSMLWVGGPINDFSVPLVLGRYSYYSSSYPLNGTIDSVRIYNKALNLVDLVNLKMK